MKFLLLCMLAACCQAQSPGESLLSRIEEHQNNLRNWEEDNSRLLTILTEKRREYDNAKQNEAKLLAIVDYLVEKNMEILKYVVTDLNKVQFNIDRDEITEEPLRDKETKTLENELEEDEENVDNEEETNEENAGQNENRSDDDMNMNEDPESDGAELFNSWWQDRHFNN